MRKHINADFFKLVIAFLIICASLKPGLSDASNAKPTIDLKTDVINELNTACTTLKQKH